MTETPATTEPKTDVSSPPNDALKQIISNALSSLVKIAANAARNIPLLGWASQQMGWIDKGEKAVIAAITPIVNEAVETAMENLPKGEQKQPEKPAAPLVPLNTPPNVASQKQNKAVG